jgi:hypothetical protein
LGSPGGLSLKAFDFTQKPKANDGRSQAIPSIAIFPKVQGFNGFVKSSCSLMSGTNLGIVEGEVHRNPVHFNL